MSSLSGSFTSNDFNVLNVHRFSLPDDGKHVEITMDDGVIYVAKKIKNADTSGFDTEGAVIKLEPNPKDDPQGSS